MSAPGAYESEDDVDYEPPTEEEGEEESDEDEEDLEAEVAEHGDFDITLTMNNDDDENGQGGAGEDDGQEVETSGYTHHQTVHISFAELLRGQSGLARLLLRHMGGSQTPPRRVSRPTDGQKYPKVPSEAGTELMNSGTFGTTDEYVKRAKAKQKKLANRLMQRSLGLNGGGRDRAASRAISQGLIPSSAADSIIHYTDRCYSGQFSDDGNFFFSCAQDFKVRMYDTSNPYSWKYYKTVEYPMGQWTITDASLSPDNKYLAYSSIKDIVCLATTDPNDDSQPYLLDFSQTQRSTRGYHGGWYRFAIWSIRFSGDGREIVAGTGDSAVYVYDIESRKSVLRIPGHEDHVNAVCYGDSSSPHILYSGSDDTTLKVWDRRSMGDGREAGAFMGHTEGLTYVDSKGDGRYVLSNGKDQLMKLWDLRKMMSTAEADKIHPMEYSSGFDYRRGHYDDRAYVPPPYDCSVVTFRGHSVLRTLIRCHFSPPGSTDSRYVYSGSEDGSIYVYNLDATIAGKIDVQRATDRSRPRDPSIYDDFYGSGDSMDVWRTCVRDASWHPNAPVVAATSWNGWGLANGTCSVHSWNDGAEEDEAEPKMGIRLDPKLRHDVRLYDNPRQRAMDRRGYRARGARVIDDD